MSKGIKGEPFKVVQVALNALGQLPELSREVVSLRLFGGMRYKEIAAMLDKTEIRAKVTFFRAKDQLMKQLEGSEWI